MCTFSSETIVPGEVLCEENKAFKILKAVSTTCGLQEAKQNKVPGKSKVSAAFSKAF